MSRSDTMIGGHAASEAPARPGRGAALRPEMARLEREVARLETALLEQARCAMADREAEREAIARELHDKFGQYLTVMELELATLGGRGTPAPERVEKLKSLTAQARQDVANMAWQIRPACLSGLDLERACALLTQDWSERSGLSFDLHLSLGAHKLPAPVETTLYRVLQEALTNVAKHAGATQVGVILRAAPQEAVMVVEDNGGGFAQGGDKLASGASLGLRGIRERLALVGGSLEIETSPGLGAALFVRVPL